MSDNITDELVINLGRRAPFTQVGDWVMMADIRQPAKVLYWALSSHINADRRRRDNDTDVWPTQEMLAAMLGYSRADKIRPFLADLVAIDAIEIEKVPVPGGGNRESSVYTVHQTPPPGYTGWSSLGEFHADFYAKKNADEGADSRGPKRGSANSRGLKWGP